MRVVLQRVTEAAVSAGNEKKAAIKKGFLLLVGISKGDTSEVVEKMAQKISKLRIFEDEHGKMNLDLKSVNGEVLSVPQFTLLGETEKGLRPGFDLAQEPGQAKTLWEQFNDCVRASGISVAVGEFGVHMEVSLVNDGPVTFVLDSKQV